MALISQETERLVCEKAAVSGRTPDELVRDAIRLAGESLLVPPRSPARRFSKEELAARLEKLSARAAARPLLDARTADEIMGFDDTGIPA